MSILFIVRDHNGTSYICKLTCFILCAFWDVFSCTSVFVSPFPYTQKTAFTKNKKNNKKRGIWNQGQQHHKCIKNKFFWGKRKKHSVWFYIPSVVVDLHYRPTLVLMCRNTIKIHLSIYVFGKKLSVLWST